jgi:hypothetical protein
MISMQNRVCTVLKILEVLVTRYIQILMLNVSYINLNCCKLRNSSIESKRFQNNSSSNALLI